MNIGRKCTRFFCYRYSNIWIKLECIPFGDTVQIQLTLIIAVSSINTMFVSFTGHLTMNPLVLLIIVLAAIQPNHGQFLANDDNPSLIDRVLQVVWEPSSLIRMWVGLDQLYNIVLSWRTVAKRLASLPFGEGRSMDHVKLQEPRSVKYNKPSVSSQWERFNKIYASSNLSPIVANTRSRMIYNQISDSILPDVRDNNHNTIESDSNSAVFRLPPPYLFQTQEVFLDPYSMDLLESPNEIDPSSPFANRYDPIFKLIALQKQENRNFLQDGKLLDPFGGTVPLVPPRDSSAVNGDPQERLNMFLKLMRTLRVMHSDDIRREILDASGG